MDQRNVTGCGFEPESTTLEVKEDGSNAPISAADAAPAGELAMVDCTGLVASTWAAGPEPVRRALLLSATCALSAVTAAAVDISALVDVGGLRMTKLTSTEPGVTVMLVMRVAEMFRAAATSDANAASKEARCELEVSDPPMLSIEIASTRLTLAAACGAEDGVGEAMTDGVGVALLVGVLVAVGVPDGVAVLEEPGDGVLEGDAGDVADDDGASELEGAGVGGGGGCAISGIWTFASWKDTE
jgi:hypothetical protein